MIEIDERVLRRLSPPYKEPALQVEGRRRLLAWLERTGSHPAKRHHPVCWLLGKRCGSWLYNCEKHHLPDGTVDHPQAFVKNGQPFAWISQPYNLDEEARLGLAEFCKQWKLTWWEDPEKSWWYPGSTTLIVVQRQVALSTSGAGEPL